MNYKESYLNVFGYVSQEFIPSEISGAPAVDIHHIISRGMGGSNDKDINRLENIMAVTREEHLKYGDKKKYYVFLFKCHMCYLDDNNIKFDKDFFMQKIKQYKL